MCILILMGALIFEILRCTHRLKNIHSNINCYNLYLSILLHHVTYVTNINKNIFFINNPSVCQRKNKTKQCSQNNY
jgi:hypothetical protein